MPRKYVAFDIETAKSLPAHVDNLLAHRPLGICCAATLKTGETAPRVWHSRLTDQSPAPSMSRMDAAELVAELARMVQDGFTIVTWNGLGFDFDVLAEESNMWSECRELARRHVDMMFHVFCERGFPVGLDKACEGMRLLGKSVDIDQCLVPQLWADGEFEKVIAYVGCDVQATLNLAVKCEQARAFRWITRNGKQSDLPLLSGWRTVEEALRLPEPDVSWMDKPKRRSHFTGWLQGR